jgi:hypothetical protein
MTTLHRQIDTHLGVDDAFAFIADFGNSMHWDPGTVTSEAIDAGPAGLGSRYRLGVRLGSRVAPMEYRITAFEPSSRVQLTGSGSNVEAVDDIRFSPSATGTHIDYTADIRLGGAMRLVQPFLGRAFAKLADDAVAGMRRALDERAAADERAAGDQPATEDLPA